MHSNSLPIIVTLFFFNNTVTHNIIFDFLYTKLPYFQVLRFCILFKTSAFGDIFFYI